MLFTAAKISHLGLLPQGQPERMRRAKAMVAQMDRRISAAARTRLKCEAACPKGVSTDFIARMNRDFMKASVTEKDEAILLNLRIYSVTSPSDSCSLE